MWNSHMFIWICFVGSISTEIHWCLYPVYQVYLTNEIISESMKTMTSDENGFFYFHGLETINITVVCTTIYKSQLDFVYTSEFTKVTHISTNRCDTIILTIMTFQNGSDETGYGDFYCINHKNPCGAIRIRIAVVGNKKYSSFQVSKFQLEGQSKITTPMLEELQEISAPIISGRKFTALSSRGFENASLDIKINYDTKIIQVGCHRRFNSFSEQIQNGIVNMKKRVSPIEMEAALRRNVIPLNNVHYLNQSQQCNSCITFDKFYFAPTLFSCSFESTESYKHFVFFPYNLTHHAKYHSIKDILNEDTAKEMMEISVPIYRINHKEYIIGFVISLLVYECHMHDAMKYRVRDSSKWMKLKAELTTTSQDLYLLKGWCIPLKLALEIREIEFEAQIWNSNRIIRMSQNITIYKDYIPKFERQYTQLVRNSSDGFNITCFAASDFPINYTWSFTPTHGSTMIKVLPKQLIHNNVSLLYFPKYSKDLDGDYDCNAVNYIGYSNTRIHLISTDIKYPEYYLWPFKTIVIGSIILLLFILAIISLILFLTMKSRMFEWKILTEYGIGTMEAETPANLNVDGMIPLDDRFLPFNVNGVWKDPKRKLVLLSTEPIGKGSFANVYKVKDISTGKECALKKVALQSKNLDLKETHLLSSIDNLNVMGMLDSWIEDESGRIEEDEFPTRSMTSTPKYFLFIQMELCDFNLQTWIENNPELKNRINDVSLIFKHCIEGLSVLHSQNIIHRDIKPNNIFCIANSKTRIPELWKIGDLGLAKQIEFDTTVTALLGNRDYMSPEMWNGSKTYNCKTDVFSLGLTLLEVILLFRSKLHKYQVFQNLRTNFEQMSLLQRFTFSKEFIQFAESLDKMLVVNVDERIDLKSEI